MRPFALTLILSAALVAAYGIGEASWGPGGCAVAQVSVGQIPVRWEEHSTPAGDQLDLMRGPIQIGAYNRLTGVFRKYDAARDVWSEPCEPIVALPDGDRVQPRGWKKAHEYKADQNFGIDIAKMFPCPEGDIEHCPGHIQLTTPAGTRAIDSKLAQDVIQNGIPDDRNKLRLTAIGSKAKTDQVRADLLASEQKDIADAVVFCAIDPSNPRQSWMLDDLETKKRVFLTQADPTVYLTQADGKVLHRQDGYAGAKDFQAIRKATKPYDPAKDPDLRKPAPDPKKPDPAKPDASPVAPVIPQGSLLGGALAAIALALLRWWLAR